LSEKIKSFADDRFDDEAVGYPARSSALQMAEVAITWQMFPEILHPAI
jgi:hypothetical protein